MALAKVLEDIALHWRWITVAAIAVALAVACAAVVFLCPQYVLCFTRYCFVRCRHKERGSSERHLMRQRSRQEDVVLSRYGFPSQRSRECREPRLSLRLLAGAPGWQKEASGLSCASEKRKATNH
ncbi:unnamed protein product [Toxocara canis]|uniref:Transmembrane protein n=1 Tax=Toxocara canis TaxID=6265 RepID=A0A183TVV9_TOXCA|nr:unnamed protein product [Toxocara canis]